ncbi:MAG: PfkB family carbohydrate kinase [Syntrophobacteraceae bacterium]|jgi:sulfofructose kinase
MEIDVLCVGLASYDFVYSVERHPEADEKCFSTGLLTGGGGPAANAAVSVARLGGIAAFAGYLGRDVFGSMHFEELLREGVITSLVVRGSHPTPLSTIIVKPDGKRSVVTHKGSTPALEPDQVYFTAVRPRAILFDGHQPAISVPLAKKARKQNIPTILDAGSVHQGTLELAPLCGYLAASEKFARDLSGSKDPARALGFLARIAPVAVITLGGAGLVWAARRRSRDARSNTSAGAEQEGGSIEAFAVDAVDTTGAGDIFHGAFALRIARGEDLLRALRYASAAAALGCAKMGARAAIPTKAEVESLMHDAG